MKEQSSKFSRQLKPLTWLFGLALLSAAAPGIAQTTAFLESPSPSAFVRSGVGLIRGWACDAKKIEISIDGGERLIAGYGTLRTDTAQICGGKVNTGFGLTFNWNGIGDGIHNVRAFADGNEFANVDFTVTTLGKDFITGLSGSYLIPNFPAPGKSTPLHWSTANQNFLVGDKSAVAATTLAETYVTQAGLAWLESPSQDSAESGVGLIRGWACDAKKVEVSIDGGPRQATAYGTLREDTKPVCGDTNNGFGLTFNWNTLSNGKHQIQAFADGAEFAKATFTTTNLGAEFLPDLSKAIPLQHFPSAGAQTTVRWSTPDQNFTIADTTATPSKVAVVSLINDLRNSFAVSGIGVDSNRKTTSAASGSASSNTTGVRAAKNALGLPTQLQGIVWGDTRTKQNADIQLRADGLPDTYADSKGVKAQFSNLTDSSITVTFKDGTGKPIGNPVATPISVDQVLALQEMARQVFSQKQNAETPAGRHLSGGMLLPAGYAPNASADAVFTLNKLLTNVFWHGSQATSTLVCAVGAAAKQAGVQAAVAQTACRSPLLTALREQLAMPQQAQAAGDPNQVVDPRAQRSLLFVSDVVDVPCSSGDVAACLTAPADVLQERQAALPPPLPPEGTATAVLVTAEAGSGGSINPTQILVAPGGTATFTVTPDSGYRIAEVGGCNGSLAGNIYTTGSISTACVVRASFALRERERITVTAVAGAGGSVSPTSQTVYTGDRAVFAIRPNAGYRIEAVSGCNGTLSGETYTTGPISQACTVSASFGYASAAQ